MHNLDDVLALALLIGATAASGLFAFGRARRAQMARPQMVGAFSAAIFLALCFGLIRWIKSGDGIPRPVLHFLYDLPGLAGFGLTVACLLALTVGFLVIFIRPRMVETSLEAPERDRAANVGLAVIAPPAKLPFSWGAAGLPAVWLLFHGRLVQGVALLAFSIVCAPFLDEFVPIFVYLLATYAIVIWLGRAGSAIAWAHHSATSVEDLREKERGWDLAGKILFGIFVLANVLLLLRSLG